jgi:hypothetical protein
MAWQNFEVQYYRVHLVALNSPGFGNIYAFVELYWPTRRVATLWYYSERRRYSIQRPDSGDDIRYYGRFSAAQFPDCIDLLRNESPCTSSGTMRPTACGSLIERASREEERTRGSELTRRALLKTMLRAWKFFYGFTQDSSRSEDSLSQSVFLFATHSR